MFESVLKESKIKIKIFGLKMTFKNSFALFSNKIIVVDKNGKEKRVFKIKGVKVLFHGTNSTVKYHVFDNKQRRHTDINVLMGSDALFELSEPHKERCCKLEVICHDCTTIRIGKNLACGGAYVVFSDRAVNKKNYNR